MFAVSIISQTQFNLKALSSITETCLGSSILRNTKGTPDTLGYTCSIFEALKQPRNDLVHVGVLLGSDDQSLSQVLEIVGLPFITCETTHQGVSLAICVGSLQGWRAALERAKAVELPQHIKDVFNRIAIELKVERQYLLK